MNLLSYLSFSMFLTAAYLAYNVAVAKRKTGMHLLFLLMCSCFLIVGLTDTIIFSLGTYEGNPGVIRASIIAISVFTGMLLHLILILTRKKNTLNNPWPLVISYSQCLVVLYQLFLYPGKYFDRILEISNKTTGIFLLVVSILIVVLVFAWKRRTSSLIEKKQASDLIALAFAAVVVQGASLSLFSMTYYSSLFLSIITSYVWIFGLGFFVLRHQLFEISGEIASESILKTMGDVMVITDNDLRIIQVNEMFLKIFKYTEAEIEGKYIKILFFGAGTEVDRLLDKGIYKDHDTVWYTKNGEAIAVSFSNSIIENENKEIRGVVVLARDIRERVKEQMEESNKAMALEKIYKDLKRKRDYLTLFNKFTKGRDEELIQLEIEENSLLKRLGRPEKYRI